MTGNGGQGDPKRARQCGNADFALVREPRQDAAAGRVCQSRERLADLSLIVNHRLNYLQQSRCRGKNYLTDRLNITGPLTRGMFGDDEGDIVLLLVRAEAAHLVHHSVD